MQPDGRANPNQTLATETTAPACAQLLDELYAGHREATGSTATTCSSACSSRTRAASASRPTTSSSRRGSPITIRCSTPSSTSTRTTSRSCWTDDELERLIDDYVAAARLAARRRLSLRRREGLPRLPAARVARAPARGPANSAATWPAAAACCSRSSTAFASELPELIIGVRLSVFDFVPYQTSREVGQPMDFAGLLPYQHGFGVDPDNPLAVRPDRADRADAHAASPHGVAMLNLTCGSPYYNPHIQRPAIFPPSDGYQPPEDPLVGVWRQIDVVRQCKAALPDVPLVGTGYSYLQDYLPHVAQAVVAQGWVDFVGLGRMVLSYPELPHDALTTGKLQRKLVCRTFSDCTTAPRHGLISRLLPARRALQAAARSAKS